MKSYEKVVEKFKKKTYGVRKRICFFPSISLSYKRYLPVQAFPQVSSPMHHYTGYSEILVAYISANFRSPQWTYLWHSCPDHIFRQGRQWQAGFFFVLGSCFETFYPVYVLFPFYWLKQECMQWLWLPVSILQTDKDGQIHFKELLSSAFNTWTSKKEKKKTLIKSMWNTHWFVHQPVSVLFFFVFHL